MDDEEQPKKTEGSDFIETRRKKELVEVHIINTHTEAEVKHTSRTYILL